MPDTTKDVPVALVGNKDISHLVAKYDIKSFLYLTGDKMPRIERINEVIVIPTKVVGVGTHEVKLCLHNSKPFVVNKGLATNQHYRMPKVPDDERLHYHHHFVGYIFGFDSVCQRPAN